ncbi:hypothetical protein DFS34DRAFT_624088 [Phlyctochytrium arcticum]|nr:hypothetical protein DFS34DRAFT_624088 [Phlyctochytrium arcticum]
MNADDDVPPLEDMAKDLMRQQQRRGMPQVTKNKNTVNKDNVKSAQSKSQNKEFSGFKKGFLSSSRSDSLKDAGKKQPPVAKAAQHDALPFIKPTQKADESLRFSEVQDAMKNQMSSLDQQEWLTPEFLEKIEKNPVLAKALNDPAFQQAAADLQKDPEAAFKMYSQTRPDLLSALREFAALMGDALSAMPGQPETVEDTLISPASVPIPNDLPQHEQELIKRVMADKDTQDALRDPKVQRVLAEMQKNPPTLMQALQSTDRDLQRKLKKLLECGLLQIN